VRRKGRSLSAQTVTGLVRRVLGCIKIILRKPWFFVEEETKMKRVHIKLLFSHQSRKISRNLAP
jgi:hypothetical protein